MNPIKSIKKWWFKVTHTKCDYCNQPVEEWYEAYLFPIKEWKGVSICIDCINKTENMIDGEHKKITIV